MMNGQQKQDEKPPAYDANNDLGRATDILTPIFDQEKQLRFIGIIIITLLSWATTTLEVFIRRDFGERYLSWIRLYFAYGVMVGFTFISFFSQSRMFLNFFAAFVVLSLLHQLRIFIRNRKGIRWHSMSYGVSWLSFLPVNNWLLYRFIEPVLFFGIGVAVFTRFDRTTGAWVSIAAVALLVKNTMLYYQVRGRYLDMADGQIENDYFNESMNGAPMRQTAGFQMVQMPKALRMSFKRRASTEAATPSRFEETLKAGMRE